MVAWDANLRVVTHLYAGYTLEVFEPMRVNNVWKEKGLVIGSPAFQLPISRTVEWSITKVEGTWSLNNQIEFTLDRVQHIFDFLAVQEKSLTYIENCDTVVRESLLSSSKLTKTRVHIPSKS